jgi:hypothetical protein
MQSIGFLPDGGAAHARARLWRIVNVAWIGSPAWSFTTGFTFDLTGGRATY